MKIEISKKFASNAPVDELDVRIIKKRSIAWDIICRAQNPAFQVFRIGTFLMPSKPSREISAFLSLAK